uniref:Uncharacterized protein n=1 Tax=Chromera velia CCMP2878 TaxID=1169474 RepID=A0A0G4IA34_9ALVE|mmetsp:Transcript_2282/g.4811  ORF Transcript_2282/g.4811 Transcript_2282/m.4811 type:complete len:205 (-) Transcript_2282:743-1357(-)|eukprot:Cvel_12349.t1-p1 / transcript=Cvel_12349.t1 / gene=Cvel_12349 / organism=Chromera_velia_CCMP2878 / gene_product=hypothetical protein / transcript_product=hypothetical protein / location=Cvel_scaffold803:54052-54663(-) / protein_length=204 / sequence_SO=supercontig / SO=protein_coding / is_pseudo=false
MERKRSTSLAFGTKPEPGYLDPPTAALVEAAEKGDLSYIKQKSHAAERGFTSLVMDTAATFGQMEVVRFLHQHRTEGCTYMALHGAVCHGHLDVADFLLKHRCEGIWAAALLTSLIHGDVGMINFLMTNSKRGDDQMDSISKLANDVLKRKLSSHETATLVDWFSRQPPLPSRVCNRVPPLSRREGSGSRGGASVDGGSIGFFK